MDYYGTIGPSCEDIETLEKMFLAGMTGIRINLSHKTLEDCDYYIKNINIAAKNCNITPRILIDIQGPELRIGSLNKPLQLETGECTFLGFNEIPIGQDIFSMLTIGENVLLDDSLILLKVIELQSNYAKCEIIRGGTLHSKKSIALEGVDINGPTLTEEDYINLSKINKYGITDVMLPFVRSRGDIITLREALKKFNATSTKIMAKIENLTGVSNLPSFIDLADEIIIARGDLGNNMPLYKLPKTQKKISCLCNENKKPFMVVTQLLNSMINSSIPTRAEVCDIFNAVLDGASSLMLTGETAIGKFPVDAITYLVKTAEEAVKFKESTLNK